MMVNKVKVFIRRAFYFLMIHLNEGVRQGSAFDRAVDYLLVPERYNAPNIRDFLEGRSMIVPTRRRIGPARSYNGYAVISLDSKPVYTVVDSDTGNLADWSACNVNVSLAFLTPSERDLLGGQARLELAHLMYHVENETCALTHFCFRRDSDPRGRPAGLFLLGKKLVPA